MTRASVVSACLAVAWSAVQVGAQWTAYNDVCYSSTSGHPGLQPNVTTYNIGSGSPGPASGVLKDKATGASTGATLTLTQNGTVIWQPSTSSGGTDCSSGTDARTIFDPAATVSLVGTVYYGSTGWWVDASFTGLNPAKQYTFVTTANRANTSYTDRLTRYTISGADAFTNTSSSGTTVGGGGASTTFCTGSNTAAGYVARWTAINPGADGSFKVRAEAGSTQNSAYAFHAIQLVELSSVMLAATTLEATAVQPNTATLNGQLTNLGGEPQAEVYFRWGTSPTSLTETTALQTLTGLGAFSSPLSGLSPETVYYYRAVAQAGPKVGEGAMRSFVWTSNYGLQFNGSNSHATMGTAPGLGSDTFTLEAWFKRTGPGQTAGSGTGGVTAVPLVCKGASEGDGSNLDANYFFGIRAGDDVLAADFEDVASSSNNNHPVAGVTAIQNNVWYHAAATYDGTTWRLYLNGVLETELAANATPRFDSIQHFGLGTAMNSTGAQSGRFEGVMDEVRVWDHARSTADIRAAMNTQLAGPAPGLLGRWGLGEGSGTSTADSSGNGFAGTLVNTAWAVGAPFNINIAPEAPVLVAPADGSDSEFIAVPLTVHVADHEGDPLQVTYYGRSIPGAPRPAFTIVAVPDTQYYSESYPATFTNQVQWILNNRASLNIVYAGHEGDIVNVATSTQQWQNANNALSLYDGVPDLPFGLAVGNHDEDPNGNASGTGYFNTWFPYTRYQGRPWYGGHQGTTNDNHYILFTAGGMDFIAVHIKYDTSGSPATLAWVGDLLATHADRRAILVTHSLLETTSAWTGQGAIIYNALKGYPNLFLMLCGHNHGESRRTDVYQGNTLRTLLADYQSRSNGGDGWLRLLEFLPDENRINVQTYSTTLGQYERDADSEFTLDYDMGGAQYAPLGTVAAASDTEAAYTWAALEPGHTYQWYAAVSDGHTTITGPAWSFRATHPPTPEIALDSSSLAATVQITGSLPNGAFTVTNAGPGTLNYTITDDVVWLSLQPATGESAGEADTIEVLYDVELLPVGQHTATITVASPDAWNSPRTIAVLLDVQTVKPDFDLDGDVDQDDFGHLQACLTASGGTPDPPCLDCRLDADGDVDGVDINAFIACFAGPQAIPVMNCLP